MGIRPKKKRNISVFLQNPILKIFMFILPIRLRYHLINAFGALYYYSNKKEKKKIINSILETKGMLDPSIPPKRIIEKTFHGIYSHYYEKYLTGYYTFAKYTKYLLRNIKMNNQELLNNKLNQNKNVIMFTAHFGGVEFLPLFLSLNNYKVRIIAKGKTKSIMKAYRFRGRRGKFAIIDGSGKNVFYKAIRWIRQEQKRILIVTFDEFEDWKTSKKKTINFLGKNIYPDKTPEILAKKSDASILVAFLLRERRDRYCLHFIDINKTNTNQLSVEEEILKVLEKYIVNYPEQWYQWKNLDILKTST